MVDVGDDRHVADVVILVHDGTDLVDCEVHLGVAEQEPLLGGTTLIKSTDVSHQRLKEAIPALEGPLVSF